jgi:hypothetical protein
MRASRDWAFSAPNVRTAGDRRVDRSVSVTQLSYPTSHAEPHGAARCHGHGLAFLRTKCDAGRIRVVAREPATGRGARLEIRRPAPLASAVPALMAYGNVPPASATRLERTRRGRREMTGREREQRRTYRSPTLSFDAYTGPASVRCSLSGVTTILPSRRCAWSAFGRSDVQCSPQHSQNAQSTARWQRRHFQDHSSIMPGTLMPPAPRREAKNVSLSTRGPFGRSTPAGRLQFTPLITPKDGGPANHR